MVYFLDGSLQGLLAGGLGSSPCGLRSVLKTWRLASPRASELRGEGRQREGGRAGGQERVRERKGGRAGGEERVRERGGREAVPFTNIQYHFCHILFMRSESVSPTYTQRKGNSVPTFEEKSVEKLWIYFESPQIPKKFSHRF